ncbi:MAG: hypothetical protein U9N49_03245 [Campylobacterota bacterium]|nr:hypothetical protein [Campylobacterota bacterium]
MNHLTNRWASKPTLRKSIIFDRVVSRRFGTAKRLEQTTDNSNGDFFRGYIQ